MDVFNSKTNLILNSFNEAEEFFFAARSVSVGSVKTYQYLFVVKVLPLEIGSPGWIYKLTYLKT